MLYDVIMFDKRVLVGIGMKLVASQPNSLSVL